MIRQTLNLAGITPLNRSQIEYFVHLAGVFSSRIIFEHRNRIINGKSMLGILSMGSTGDDPVTLEVEGEDEEKAYQAIRELLDNGVAPPKNETDAMKLMQVIKDRYQALLEDNLVGIYLHGSLAAGCFRWERSDIDFLVVVRRPMEEKTKIGLVETLYALSGDAPPKGFEMSVLLESSSRKAEYPIPFELHYSNAHRKEYEADPQGYCSRMQGQDPDLSAHILALYAYGCVVHGPTVPRVFGQVKREDALRALLYDAEDAPKRLHDDPVYYVLNLCRAAAYVRDDAVLNKKQGGEWALKHMSTDHQRVIQAALNAYDSGLDMFYDHGQAEDFCFEALETLKQGKV